MQSEKTLTPDPGDVVMTALGSDVRRDILRLLAGGPRPAGGIAAAFPISRPAVSKHLRLLSEAGLIRAEAQGRQQIYSLEQRGFEAGHSWLDGFWPDALARFRMLAENTYDRDEAAPDA